MVFLGSEAVARGDVTRHELQRWYRPIYRDVYVPARRVVTLRDRTVGAWLWSQKRAVIAGVAASALHGARWVDDEISIELISGHFRPQRGIVARQERIGEDEIARSSGPRLPVTTPARTAFDLGRHLPRVHALARLDALMQATPFSVDDVNLLGERYRGARGVRRLRAVLPLVDGGAASPRESWLRLLLVDAGFPVPTTQIPVTDGRLVAVLDMGWKRYMVAAEYDGDQHRSSRAQYVKDMRRLRMLGEMGWIVIRVIAEDRPADIVNRVYEALKRRGFTEFHPEQGATRTSAA